MRSQRQGRRMSGVKAWVVSKSVEVLQIVRIVVTPKPPPGA